MAVPFALPEDEINNLIAAVIFLLSQSRLQHTEENRELQECMEMLVRLLTEEIGRRSRSSEYDNQLKQTLILLRLSLNQFTTPTLVRIPRRNRLSSESSCCEEDNKIHVQENDKDSRQVGLILPKIVDDETSAKQKEIPGGKQDFIEKSFLSRFVPRVRRTFWTTLPLICIVGWHLFQTTNCM